MAQDEARFMQLCSSAADYPKNTIHHNIYEHVLDAYAEQLNEQQNRLFCEDSKAAVNIWDYDDRVQAFQSLCVRTISGLQEYLGGLSSLDRRDPRCRFIFIDAPNSRDRLNITRRMLVYALTYHQVIPAFLDFLFCFGRQQDAQDFHFSGFRHETHLNAAERALNSTMLGRSGRDIHMCYNLKSVERYPNQPHWPWSIRQMALYHSFDVETGNSFWIVVKGNQVMKQRVESATRTSAHSDMSSFDGLGKAFASSLATQLLLCDWCVENWRWYINFLEETLREATRRASIKIFKLPDPAPGIDFQAVTHRTLSGRTLSPDNLPLQVPLSPPPPTFAPPRPTQIPQPQPPMPPSLPNTLLEQDDFSFSDLQHVQYIEDKANELLLVLDANAHVLTEVGKYYQSIISSGNLPEELLATSKPAYARFEQRIASIINDLQMQHSRAKTLLKLLADRKNLLYGILEYHNIQTGKLLSTRAQHSARRMESMTRDMHQIAQKTKQETVSMRIITLVTLFFLPGTFISTVMSTDIIHYGTDPTTGASTKNFQLGALQLYLTITIPFMVVTFMAWYGVYWWVDRKQEEKARQLREQAEAEGGEKKGL